MLACLPKTLGFSLICSAVLLGACFDPDNTPIDTDGNGVTGDTGSSGGTTVCEPGSTQDCTCPDGSASTQTCDAAGAGFDACECGGEDTGSTTNTTDETTTGPPPECTMDEDCADMAQTECEVGVCGDDGTCSVEPLAEGEPCGDPAESECSGADTCDGAGTCSANDLGDGSACTGCPLGICACAAGECGDCATFAPTNNFITTRSVEGWDLTGGWGLYREAPQNFSVGPTVFSGQVFGTDGNRAEPYPSNDDENSFARTPPMILPATLDFMSWNVDEGGGGVDNKTIRISTDGGATFMPVADCAMGGGFPFCQFRDDSRAPDDWDMVSIPVPPPAVGQVGIVEFAYVTGDSCCNFEKGWFIDVANFATECACQDDASCMDLGGECGTGVCGGSGECELDAVAADTACGDGTDIECNAPDTCDGLGYCTPNVAPTGLTQCVECPAGAGNCNACQDGVCVDCMSQPPSNDFGAGSQSFEGWLIEDLSGMGTGADWQIYFEAPRNTQPGSTPIGLTFAPSFGTDGNLQAPYMDMGMEELEHSRVTTTPDTVPMSINFASWHVDEGGQSFDTKLIELSVDGGASWNTLVDCTADPMAQPFCQLRLDERPGGDWDLISLDTAAWAGMVGILRITYNTVDSCCGSERGWFIDNLNFAQYCSDPAFPPM